LLKKRAQNPEHRFLKYHTSAKSNMDVPNGNDIRGMRNLSQENIAVNKIFIGLDGMITSVADTLPLFN